MCEENKKKEVNIFLNNIYRFVEKEIAKGKYEKAMNMEVERTKSVRNAPLFSKTTREKFGALQKASMEKYEEER